MEKLCIENGKCGFNFNNNKVYLYENLMKKISILKNILILMILLIIRIFNENYFKIITKNSFFYFILKIFFLKIKF